jgi:trehalose utilization protein
MEPTRVTVWTEGEEHESEAVRAVYPDGIGAAIAGALAEAERFETRTATLDEPEHGLTSETLGETDVLAWWGHAAHEAVSEEVVARVTERVRSGMGFLVLHSAHHSKPFRALMGTSCDLRWREAGERERLWVTDPAHPVASGLDERLELPETETYGEHFDVPRPDSVVLTSWFEGGEVFRSGCAYHRGAGRVFYFRPGHETYPIYHDENVRRVLRNACAWAAPDDPPEPARGHSPRP